MARSTPTLSASQISALTAAAAKLGTSPHALATVIGYETAGTYSPSIKGGVSLSGKNKGRYLGLIQFSPANQKTYNVTADQSFESQLNSVVSYMVDAGFEPGMSLVNLYAAIQSFNAKANPHTTRDINGTVAEHVANMLSPSWQSKVTTALAGMVPAHQRGFTASDIGVPAYARGDFSMPANNPSTQFGQQLVNSWTAAKPVNSWTSMPGTELSAPTNPGVISTPVTGSAASSLAAARAMEGMYGQPAPAPAQTVAAPSVDAAPVGLTGGFVAADASSIAPGPFGAQAVVTAALANNPAGVKAAMTAMKNNAMAAVLYGKNLKGEPVPNVTGEQAQAAITSYFADIGRSNIAVANQIARNIINNPGLLGQLSPGEQATIVNALADPGFGKPVSEGGGAIPMLGVQGRDVASLLSTGNYAGKPTPSVYGPAPVSPAVAAQAGKGFYGAPATSPSVFTGGPASIAPSVVSQAGKGFYSGPATTSPAVFTGGPATIAPSVVSQAGKGFYSVPSTPASAPVATSKPASTAVTGTPQGNYSSATFTPAKAVPAAVAKPVADTSLSAVSFTPAKAVPATAAKAVQATTVVANPAYAAAVAANAAAAAAAKKGPPAAADIPASIALASLLAGGDYTGVPAKTKTVVPTKVPLPAKFITVPVKSKVLTNPIPTTLTAPAAKPAPPAMVGGKPVTGYTPVGRVPYSVATNATPASSGRNGVGAASVYGFGPGGTATTYGTSNGGSISMYSAPTATGGAPGTYGIFGMQSGQPSVVTGGTAGVGAGGKVFCTFFMQKGWLPKEIWKADTRYSLTLDPDMRRGYLAWAVPTVAYLKTGKVGARVLERVLWPVVREWAEEMAHRDSPDKFPGSLAGLVVLKSFGAVSLMIGRTLRYLDKPLLEGAK